MIAKERNASEHPVAKAPTAVAGEAAEKQLAFYLSRAFADTQAIAVFNDLRVVDAVGGGGGEVAQIDHLVLHPCGFVLVESKSITGSVRINKQREWIRASTRGEEGMPDAVEQARRQREVLRRYLDRNYKKLLRTGRTFAGLGFDVLAAVSDNGVIEREIPMPKVVKADQVPAKIKTIATERLRLATQPDSRPHQHGKLTEIEFTQIAEFLLRSHTPRNKPAPRPAMRTRAPQKPPPPPSPRPVATRVASPSTHPTSPPTRHCPQCNGTRIEMRWGNRPKGYYFHCHGCDKNWRPDHAAQTCPACRRPDVPLRKSKDVMLLACPDCGHAGVFHRNG